MERVASQVRGNLLSDLKKTQFQGQAHQWEAFKKDWQDYWALMEDNAGPTLRKTKLALLRPVLDKGTQ